MGGDIDQEVADMVAYLQSIAVKPEEVTTKIAFENACGRCHAVGYENWTQIGEKPKFKHEKDSLAFDIKVIEYQDSLKAYMGKLPPDLSMYIRSRNEHFISTLIENPQNHLEGTAMPRVGVTAHAAEKVIEYLEDAGDPKRHERAAIGANVMIYIVIFAIFALLWKKQVWRDLH
jgi:ubiquinol-cytochrome c reductase cytochrome c1 subunit